MSDYVFAYGTLQPGLVPASMSSVAQKLTPVGRGFVRGLLYDLGRYPGAIPDARAARRIAGTVLQLPDDGNTAREILGRLDAYEGFDPESPAASEYIRARQTVDLVDGGSLECWFYRYNLPASAAQIIESGVWEK